MSDDLWLAAPEDAYAQWQREEATGADRRAFADQSIVQHRSPAVGQIPPCMVTSKSPR
jgi:hypothetical protein